jgi:putative ABC transport system ATP-binding protein
MTAGVGIRLRDIRKEYRVAGQVVRAVDGLDLEIEAGSRVAIVGPSGCGKSTLLSLIGTLELPSQGKVWLGDTDITSLSETKRAEVRRRTIGFVFQSYDLLPFLTASENVAFQASLSGVPMDRVDDLIKGLGLQEHSAKLPDQLSGGQRQRVGLARALAHHPTLILADEPTGELDSESSGIAMDLLLEAQRELGATLVVVTHDMGIASRLDRTVSLRDGRVVGDSAMEPARA